MYNFAVVLLDGGAMTGALGINRRNLHGTYEVGFWTAKEHRGLGYMTEAVRAAAHWTFTSLRRGPAGVACRGRQRTLAGRGERASAWRATSGRGC